MVNREKIKDFRNQLKVNEDFLNLQNAFPHISTKIELICGDLMLSDYFFNLMFDTRDGKRQGFPKPIVAAISKLHDFHESFFFEELSNQKLAKNKGQKPIEWGEEKHAKKLDIPTIEFKP